MNPNNYSNTPQDDFGLEQFDQDFTEAPVEDSTAFTEPPDGMYQVIVDKVEVTRSKANNNPMLKWQLKILGPKCAGRFLFRHNMIMNAQNVKWLKNDLATCGLNVSSLKLSDLPNVLSELLDVALEVQKKTVGKYTNIYLNKRIEIDVPPQQQPQQPQQQHQGSPADNRRVDEDIPF